MDSEAEAQRIVMGHMVIQELLQRCYTADGVNSFFLNAMLQFLLNCHSVYEIGAQRCTVNIRKARRIFFSK